MEKKRIVAYIRLGNSDNAMTNLNSLKQYFREKIGSRDDCELVDIYWDIGTSGRDKKRPAYTKMLANAEAHKFDYIVVDKLARFSRDMESALKAIDRLIKLGVGFYSINEQIDSLDENYKIYRAMITTLTHICE